MVTESLEHAVLAEESSQPQSTYEVVASLTKFELKKILIDKMDGSQSYLTVAEHRECYDGLIKSYDLDKSLFSTYDKVNALKRSRKDKDKDEDPSAGSDRGLKKRKTSKDIEPTKCPKLNNQKEPEFEVANSDMPQDQEENQGNDDEEPKRKVASKRDWFTKPKQHAEPTDPDWNVGKTPQQGPNQSWLVTLVSFADKPSKTFDELMSTPIDFSAYIMNGLKESSNVPVDYFFNNDLKYLQGGISSMTYTTSTTKTKAAQYDLQVIEDMVPNIWSPVKVAYDKYALWGISHWRKQRKTFYAYARGLESSHDVYSTKRILAVTRVEVMRKHGYGYLREIEVRRADNELYTFKEGDFPILRINDIEDMLILIIQNRLINLSGDDFSDFPIAPRMFTRSMVIQKRVEDLQLGVKSYQKKINITKLETTRPDIKKRDPYTLYQDPQGFIYVDNQNIQMEYMPQRRWSSLQKKRAHIMIKAIDKQLKERRMMRSFEKFVGGRYYGTDLRLLQRTI
ncbi:hypothetical protein Tco_1103078 [Tanacetum coccineum]